METPAARKEWRAVSEHSVSSAANEELNRLKFGHSDERTIYEVQQGRDSSFFSIQMNGVGNLDDGDFEEKLHNLASQREELQQREIELRAQMIIHSEIAEMRKSFDAQMKEQTNVTTELQEQLHEREQRISELERKMEDQERELHAIRLDNETAWAKDDLLREQSMELANFRRDHDNIEAERAHHIKQIHDLQEHIQEKDRQLIELQEQHQNAQETMFLKDEQIREAQVWIAQVQEIQSNAHHSLQAELRERTEQYNQLWLGCQRQFAEMERLHIQTIQQLQLELAGAREKSGGYNNESCIPQPNSNDMSLFAQNSGSHLEANESSASTGSLPNGNSEKSQSFASSGNKSPQVTHVPGPAITPPSLLGVPSYLQPGQVAAVHPYVTHQQGANHSVPTPVSQLHAGHLTSVPVVPSYQHWQVQQAASEGVQGSVQSPHEPTQTENNLARSHFNYGSEISSNGQNPSSDHLNVHLNQANEANSIMSSEHVQVLDSVGEACLASNGQPSLQQISSQFDDVLRLAPLEHAPEMKESNAVGSNEILESKVMVTEPSGSAGTLSFSETANNRDASLPEEPASLEQTNSVPIGKTSEVLIDERSLLSCIVRTIPAGGKIRITSTLPNRLGKMLAPLHWHDYKKKYGKLDDFVSSHPELFVIEGDYIKLREGAQGIIAATAAVAKVAAAVAATTPNSSMFSSVALTPMAQANRLKKIPSVESKAIASGVDGSFTLSSMQTQHLNGASYNITGGLSNVKLLSKSKDPLAISGLSSMLDIAENGSSSDRSEFSNFQRMVQINGRTGSNFISKQEGRDAVIRPVSRR